MTMIRVLGAALTAALIASAAGAVDWPCWRGPTGMGISNNRIQARGLGKSSPVADNSSSTGRQQNRRVEVIISNSDGRTAVRSP